MHYWDKGFMLNNAKCFMRKSQFNSETSRSMEGIFKKFQNRLNYKKLINHTLTWNCAICAGCKSPRVIVPRTFGCCCCCCCRYDCDCKLAAISLKMKGCSSSLRLMQLTTRFLKVKNILIFHNCREWISITDWFANRYNNTCNYIIRENYSIFYIQ